MATQIISNSYKDIDAMFSFNPMTEDLAMKVNRNAIAFSVKNLVLTMNGERPFNDDIGTPIKKLIFELHTPMMPIVMKKMIEDVLIAHEPRIKVLEVVVLDNPDRHTVEVTIKYVIVNTTTPYTVDVVLNRTR